MAKVLICHEPGSDVPHARYFGGDTLGNPIPGEDVDAALRAAEQAHKARGHVTFFVEHHAPHTMHHGEAVEHIVRRK